MTQDYVPRKRGWREIAAEAAKETDPKRRMQLAIELDRALDQRDAALRERNVRLREQIRRPVSRTLNESAISGDPALVAIFVARNSADARRSRHRNAIETVKGGEHEARLDCGFGSTGRQLGTCKRGGWQLHI
jgi:Tfp pilus assembly protein PilX